jgi:hypothetical protein
VAAREARASYHGPTHAAFLARMPASGATGTDGTRAPAHGAAPTLRNSPGQRVSPVCARPLAGLDRSRRRLDRVLAQSVQDRFTNVALEIDDRSSTAHFSRHSPNGPGWRPRCCSSAGPRSIGTPVRYRILAEESRRTPARGPIRAALWPLVDLGAWFSPRLRAPHGPLRSGRRNGWSPQAVDPAQDFGEEHPRHRHLGQLEDDVAAVAHDPGADLDQLLAQRGQRPLRDRVG